MSHGHENCFSASCRASTSKGKGKSCRRMEENLSQYRAPSLQCAAVCSKGERSDGCVARTVGVVFECFCFRAVEEKCDALKSFPAQHKRTLGSSFAKVVESDASRQ